LAVHVPTIEPSIRRRKLPEDPVVPQSSMTVQAEESVAPGGTNVVCETSERTRRAREGNAKTLAIPPPLAVLSRPRTVLAESDESFTAVSRHTAGRAGDSVS
jgi:hypothetical protein